MAFVKKTWKRRLTEYPNRRKLLKTDGTTEIVDVERLEGTISQEGDAFSDDNMNDLEQRIADEFNNVNSNLSRFEIIYEGDETSNPNTIPIPKTLDYYDLIIFAFRSPYWEFSRTYVAKLLKNPTSINGGVNLSTTEDDSKLYLTYKTSNTVFTKFSENGAILKGVYGIKF